MGEKEILIKGLSVRKENNYCHVSVASFFFQFLHSLEKNP